MQARGEGKDSGGRSAADGNARTHCRRAVHVSRVFAGCGADRRDRARRRDRKTRGVVVQRCSRGTRSSRRATRPSVSAPRSSPMQPSGHLRRHAVSGRISRRVRRAAPGGRLWAYAALGIARSDRLARERQVAENFRLFGAPHVALLTIPAELGPYAALDCGAFVASFLLAARAHGVATTAQAALAHHARFIRRYFGIGDERRFVCGIAFGYADMTHPANAFRFDARNCGRDADGLTHAVPCRLAAPERVAAANGKIGEADRQSRVPAPRTRRTHDDWNEPNGRPRTVVQAAWNAAARDWNADALTGVYTTDALFFGGRPGHATGHEAIRAYFASYDGVIQSATLELVEQQFIRFGDDCFRAGLRRIRVCPRRRHDIALASAHDARDRGAAARVENTPASFRRRRKRRRSEQADSHARAVARPYAHTPDACIPGDLRADVT